MIEIAPLRGQHELCGYYLWLFVVASTLVHSTAIEIYKLKAPNAATLPANARLQLVTALCIVVVVSSTVEELSLLDTPFSAVYHDPLLPTCTAECHVQLCWSQSRVLVCTGSYVQLCKPFHQVCLGIH